MNAQLQAHIRLLESTPKDRIRTHERHDPKSLDSGGHPNRRSQIARLAQAGIQRPISDELIARYAEARRSGDRYIDVKRALQVSTRTMARLLNAAKRQGLL